MVDGTQKTRSGSTLTCFGPIPHRRTVLCGLVIDCPVVLRVEHGKNGPTLARGKNGLPIPQRGPDDELMYATPWGVL